jgi:hypothetical protein
MSTSKYTLLVMVGPFFLASVPPMTMAADSAARAAILANMFAGGWGG